MKLQNTSELDRLHGYLMALSYCLDGCDYVTWFDVTALEFEEDTFDLQNLFKFVYPDSVPEKAKISESSVSQMSENINEAIKCVNPKERQKVVPEEKINALIKGFWRSLDECIDYENSKIFFYKPDFKTEDELGDFVIWGFTYLVINEEQKQCLLIHGGASD